MDLLPQSSLDYYLSSTSPPQDTTRAPSRNLHQSITTSLQAQQQQQRRRLPPDPLNYEGYAPRSSTNSERTLKRSASSASPDRLVASTVDTARANPRPQNLIRSSSGGLLSLATAALDRTHNALANISDPVLRHRPSNPALVRLSRGSGFFSSKSDGPSHHKNLSIRSVSSQSLPTSGILDARTSPQSPLVLEDPPSQRYSETDDHHPLPIRVVAPENTMHQTSSRLLRMTPDDRPFTRVSN